MKKLPLHAIAEMHETLYKEHVATHSNADGSSIFAVDGSNIRLAPALAQHAPAPTAASARTPLPAHYRVRCGRGMIASMDISASFGTVSVVSGAATTPTRFKSGRAPRGPRLGRCRSPQTQHPGRQALYMCTPATVRATVELPRPSSLGAQHARAMQEGA